MEEFETERIFGLPTKPILYNNVITAAFHRALMSRGFTPEKFPDFVEALYLGLRPNIKEKVFPWRQNEEEKIEREVWEKTGDRRLAKIQRYSALLEKIVEELDKAGMFVVHVRKVWGAERGLK